MTGRIEDSWVEASTSAQSSPEGPNQNSPLKKTPRQAQRQRNKRPARSTEPEEFVMPPLDSDTLEASWADNGSIRSSRSPRKSSVQRKNLPAPEPRTPSSIPEQKPRLRTSTSVSRPPDTSEVLLGHVGTMFTHMFDILGRSLRLLKTPLSVALAAFLLLQIGLVARGFIVSSIYSSMSPLCAIPGSSLLNLPFCSSSTKENVIEGRAEFDQLMNVQSKFEDVLRETAVGITLPIDMKRSEASIRDLRQLVKYSHLASKQELGLEFDGFIETAKQAAFDLQKFNSHIGRAVDQVLSTTRWTLRVLDDISIRESQVGSLSQLSNKLLSPFKTQKFAEAALLDQYIKHASSIEDQLHILINEAMLLLMVLNNLDDRLEVIHSIVHRENAHISEVRSEILGELWTLVGGNRKELSRISSQMGLLQQVNTYRNTAYAHVSGTMLKLQEISAGIEDLRERVGGPENLRDRVDIPLSVHLESIQLGVERLEGSREMEKKAEIGNLGRSMEGRIKGGNIIEG